MLGPLLLLCLSGGRPVLSGGSAVLTAQQHGANGSRQTALGHSQELFLQFIAQYNRSRSPGRLGSAHQYKAFQESIQRQHALNSLPSDLLVEKGSATYGINQFSDLAPEIFRATYLCSKPSELPKYKPFDSEVKRLHLPTRFDWRDKNVVTRVRNQGSCGGCWAFSVVEVIESAYAIKGKPLQTFSAQEVIDCSYKDGGCNGGSPVSALKWLNQTKTRLVTESMYPFKAKTGMCHHFPMSTFGISIKGYQAYSFRHKEEEMMHKLLEWGPLIAVVDAVSWQDYLGGIIQHHCSPEESNHAVVITGYDRTGDIPYWIVRNSWGSTWGIDGFVHIKMKRNVCGIADSVAAGFV